MATLVPDPLSKAIYGTYNFMDSSQLHFCCATMWLLEILPFTIICKGKKRKERILDWLGSPRTKILKGIAGLDCVSEFLYLVHMPWSRTEDVILYEILVKDGGKTFQVISNTHLSAPFLDCYNSFPQLLRTPWYLLSWETWKESVGFCSECWPCVKGDMS